MTCNTDGVARSLANFTSRSLNELPVRQEL